VFEFAAFCSFLSTLNAQGWRFIPTWVGLQAACTSYAHKMSYNTTTAYNEGVAEANEAITAAQALGLTEADGSGTVIYFDLEAITSVTRTAEMQPTLSSTVGPINCAPVGTWLGLWRLVRFCGVRLVEHSQYP